MSRSNRIGLYGGTFDPIHNGHLYVVTELLERDVVDQIILVPAGEPWLRENAPVAAGEDRLKMCQLAIAELDLGEEVLVNSIEIRRSGPSYTIDSAKELRQKFGPDVSLIWLMGADSFLQLYTWNDWRDLSRYIHLAVASRPPYSIQKQLKDHPPLQAYYLDHQTKLAHDLCSKASGLIYLDEQLSIDLASSSLRPLLSSNNTANRIQEWLPKSIHALILKKGLYQSTR